MRCTKNITNLTQTDHRNRFIVLFWKKKIRVSNQKYSSNDLLLFELTIKSSYQRIIDFIS